MLIKKGEIGRTQTKQAGGAAEEVRGVHPQEGKEEWKAGGSRGIAGGPAGAAVLSCGFVSAFCSQKVSRSLLQQSPANPYCVHAAAFSVILYM